MRKISVIIPVYNVEKYLIDCLESVVSQTYKNLEIIIVNDGSTDCSGDISDEYEKKDERIRVVHQKNMGLSGARNTGIDMATGEYITFLDSDDYLEIDILEKLVKILEKNKSDIAVAGINFCNEQGKTLYEQKSKGIKKYVGKNQLYNLLTSNEINTMAWGKLYRISLFKDLRYPLHKYHEDVFLTYKLLDQSKSTIVIPDIGVHYRQVKTSIVHSTFCLKHLDSIQAMQERSKFIEKKYPVYRKYTYADIVYSCVKVFEKMINANFHDIKIEKLLQKEVRRYVLKFWFYSKSSLTTKIFSLVMMLNMNLCRKLYLIISRGENS